MERTVDILTAHPIRCMLCCSMTRNEQIRRVALLCIHCARNAAYYRAWWDNKEFLTNDDFYRNANSNDLDMAVLAWCKLFIDRGGKQNWRKVVPNPDQFMPELCAQLGIDMKIFDEHYQKTKTYRDKFLAHLDEDLIMYIPKLAITVDSVIFLYGNIKDEYAAQLNDDPADLVQYYREHFALGKRHAIDRGLSD